MLVQNQGLSLSYIKGSNNSEIILAQSKTASLNRVLKTIKHKKYFHAKECEQLQNEAQILFGLEHPYIIKPFSFQFCCKALKEECCLLELPYAKMDLFQYITEEEKKLISQDKINLLKLQFSYHKLLFSQLVQAVDYLHRTANVAHNDIKLANIFISQQNNCLLADFGFSTYQPANQTLKNQWQKWGTRNELYLAPELYQLKLQSENQIDNQDQTTLIDEKAADIFTLGVILFEQIFKNQPNNFKFDKSDIKFKNFYLSKQEILHKIVDENKLSIKNQILQLNTIGVDTNQLFDLILGMMAINPKDRLTSNEILAHGFFN